MSDTKHTPEPWEVFPEAIIIHGNKRIANCQAWFSTKNSEANARRIVACVNACAGMADPEKEISALRAAAEKAREYLKWKNQPPEWSAPIPPVFCHEALAALEEVLG